VFGRKENPRQMLRGLGDGPELVDPADDFIAKRCAARSAAGHFCLAHAFPVQRRVAFPALADRYKFNASEG
jgi:hypothetical protein